MKCKITGEKLSPFMSFGKMPSANGFLDKKDFENEFFYEMEVGFSEKVSLLQLNEFSNPVKVHNERYPFYTSSSINMKKHFNRFGNWLKEKYLSNGSKLIEVGSNDGTMLENFKDTNINAIGFEPSKTIADQANKKNIKTLSKFFNTQNLDEIKSFHSKVDVICSANVIAHIPDLKDVIKSVDKLLSSKGMLIFEEPYLGSMFSKVSYDQIYDEHIFMFSVTSINKIFDLFDFELVDVLPQNTHGGSMRYVIGRRNKHKKSDEISKFLDEEQSKKLDTIESCLAFKNACELSKKMTISKLNKLKENNKKICGYAATAKSTTVLNYCKIGNNLIDYICDTTKEKIGKFSPGAHIPIVSMSHFEQNIPDVAFLFAWNHKDEIFLKEKKFKENGGTWFSHVAL